MPNKTIGSLLLDSGKISAEQAELIINKQQASGEKFGDAAVSLGFVSDNDIKFAVSQQFDYSFLASDDESIDHCLISAFLTYGPEVEAFRALRSQLTLRWMSENKSILITSPTGGVGVSYTCANLAVLFAQLGMKTLLIDANMRSPSQHCCFKRDNTQGLSQVLSNRVGVDCIYDVNGIKGLSVLFAGVTPPNPMELIARSNFKELHTQLESIFDVIIIDAPPILEFSETELMASIIKGVVLVGKKETTPINDLIKSKNKIEAAGGIPIGAVLNEFDSNYKKVINK